MPKRCSTDDADPQLVTKDPIWRRSSGARIGRLGPEIVDADADADADATADADADATADATAGGCCP